MFPVLAAGGLVILRNKFNFFLCTPSMVVVYEGVELEMEYEANKFGFVAKRAA